MEICLYICYGYKIFRLNIKFWQNNLGFKGIKSDKTVKKEFCLEHGLKLLFVSKVQSTCATNRKKVMELTLKKLLNNL